MPLSSHLLSQKMKMRYSEIVDIYSKSRSFAESWGGEPSNLGLACAKVAQSALGDKNGR